MEGPQIQLMELPVLENVEEEVIEPLMEQLLLEGDDTFQLLKGPDQNVPVKNLLAGPGESCRRNYPVKLANLVLEQTSRQGVPHSAKKIPSKDAIKHKEAFIGLLRRITTNKHY